MPRIIQNAAVHKWIGTRLEPQLYSALDPAITREVHDALAPTFQDPVYDGCQALYDFERCLQGVAFTMMNRGIRIDEEKRTELKRELGKERTVAVNAAHKVATAAGWEKLIPLTAKIKPCLNSTRKDKQHKWPRGVPDKDRYCENCKAYRLVPQKFNPLSNPDTAALLYDHLGLKKQRDMDGKVTVNKEALQKLYDHYLEHRSVLLKITTARHLDRLIDMASAKVGRDGRMHSNWNVGATETDRWSSSEDCYKEGIGLQTTPREIRGMYVADPSWRLFYADLSQAESRCIAYLAEDEGYIEAHKSGNVHLWVARNVLLKSHDWTGDDATDLAWLKNTPVPWDPANTFYDNMKRSQHGMNYGLKAQGLVTHTGMPFSECRKAYTAYHKELPGIKRFHAYIRGEIKRTGVLVSVFGRPRQFFGRSWDQSTVKEGIAHLPQNLTVTYLSIGLLKVWQELDPERVQVLGHGHDAIFGQYHPGDEAVLDKIREMLYLELQVHGRSFHIPLEIETAQSWDKCS